MIADPYRTLGVSSTATEAEVRDAYRGAVKRHHPDHNGGSPESARRFEEIQEAWAEIRRRRSAAGPGAPGRARGAPRAGGSPPPGTDPDLEDRLRTMEAELRKARSARATAAADARRAAAEAAQEARRSAEDTEPASDEELGYIRSDDSFTRILSDARGSVLGNLDGKPARDRAADVLEEVAAMLRGERRSGDRKGRR